MTKSIDITLLNTNPPEEYFDIVLRKCPKAALLYKLLWKKKDEDFRVIIDKKKIYDDFECLSLKELHHNIRLLNQEKLLNYIEDRHFINIELTGWKNETESYDCF